MLYPKGAWGHAPPGKFWNWDCFWDQLWANTMLLGGQTTEFHTNAILPIASYTNGVCLVLSSWPWISQRSEVILTSWVILGHLKATLDNPQGTKRPYLENWMYQIYWSEVVVFHTHLNLSVMSLCRTSSSLEPVLFFWYIQTKEMVVEKLIQVLL